MSKRTLFLIFALFLINFVLLIIALYTPKSKPTTTQIIPTPEKQIAQTILSFGNPIIAASSSTKSALQTYSLPINIITGKNKATAVQLELQYDPKVLTSVSVTPGVFFKNPIVLLNQIDAKTGRISYAFGISPTQQGIGGQGIVATLSFESKTGAPQQTSIIFLPKTLVTAELISQSALKQTSNIQLTVGKINSTPSAR